MRLRNLGTVLMAGALLVGLAACGDDDDDDAGGATTTAASGGGAAFTPVKADTLTVVTSLPAPGFWNGDDPAAITGGYEYEIATAMQEKLGLANLDVRNVSFDQLVAGQVGDFDIAFSQVTITDERKQVVDFTEPVLRVRPGRPRDGGHRGATTSTDAKELQWGVQSGTTGEALRARDAPAVERARRSSRTSRPASRRSAAGQVDAFMMDTAIVLAQAAESGGEQVVAAQFKTGEQYGAHPAEGLDERRRASTSSSPSSRPTARSGSSPRSTSAAIPPRCRCSRSSPVVTGSPHRRDGRICLGADAAVSRADAPRRRRSIALVGAVAVAVVTVAALLIFYDSLAVGRTPRRIWAVVLAIIAVVAALAVVGPRRASRRPVAGGRAASTPRVTTTRRASPPRTPRTASGTSPGSASPR